MMNDPALDGLQLALANVVEIVGARGKMIDDLARDNERLRAALEQIATAQNPYPTLECELIWSGFQSLARMALEAKA